MFLGSENNYLIEWGILRRPTEASFPQEEVLNFRFGAWCLVCNRFSSEERKERKSEGLAQRNSRKLIWVKSSRKMFLRRWPKHISPNITRAKKKKKNKLFSWKTEFQCFFFFFCMQPIRTKTSEPEDFRQDYKRYIFRKPSLQIQPTLSWPEVGSSIYESRLILHLFQSPAICFLTLHQLPQAGEEAEKEKNQNISPRNLDYQGFFFSFSQ